jgi:Family of unknown function (DUF6118)
MNGPTETVGDASYLATLRADLDKLHGSASQHDANMTAALDALVEQLSAVAKAQSELAKTPALALTPALYERDIATAMVEPLRRATEQLETRAQIRRDADAQRLHEAAHTQLAAERATWRNRCYGALAAGFVLYPLLAASIPGGTWLAAWATGHLNAWDAGSHLMSSADLAKWNRFADHWTAFQQAERRAP